MKSPGGRALYAPGKGRAKNAKAEFSQIWPARGVNAGVATCDFRDLA
jgi:hypothetical protein